MQLKTLSAKWRPFCLVLNVLIEDCVCLPVFDPDEGSSSPAVVCGGHQGISTHRQVVTMIPWRKGIWEIKEWGIGLWELGAVSISDKTWYPKTKTGSHQIEHLSWWSYCFEIWLGPQQHCTMFKFIFILFFNIWYLTTIDRHKAICWTNVD